MIDIVQLTRQTRYAVNFSKVPAPKKIGAPTIQMARHMKHTRKAVRKTHRKHRKSQKQQRKH